MGAAGNDLPLDKVLESNVPITGLIGAVTYVVITSLLMVNLLIAMFSKTFDR